MRAVIITTAIVGATVVFGLCALANLPAIVTCLACGSIFGAAFLAAM